MMTSARLSTEYLPAERASKEDLQRQSQRFSDAPSQLLRRILDAVPEILIVLNKERQIVFSNQSLALFLGLKNDAALFGLRPGEAMNCIHAFESEYGCGTTEFCRECGVARSILTSRQGQATNQECRITRKSGEALDLQVWATPFSVGDEQFTIFIATDTSHEKRRRVLERIFFHDIANVTQGQRLLVDLLQTGSLECDNSIDTLDSITTRLTDEIDAQRELVAAENQELIIHPTPIDAMKLLREIVSVYNQHEARQGRHIRVDTFTQDIKIVSDRTLLRRVIVNMVKNALEACNPGETVTLGCKARGEEIEFWVHNPTSMPRHIQLQVFQRSFSTKGAGRGLGTYSMKYLSERYLKGNVSFTTSPEGGTTFSARYPYY